MNPAHEPDKDRSPKSESALQPVNFGPDILPPGQARRIIEGTVCYEMEVSLGMADPQLQDHVVEVLNRALVEGTLRPTDPYSGKPVTTMRDVQQVINRRIDSDEAREKSCLFSIQLADYLLFAVGNQAGFLRAAEPPLLAVPEDLIPLVMMGKEAYHYPVKLAGYDQSEATDLASRLSDEFEMLTIVIGRVARELYNDPAIRALLMTGKSEVQGEPEIVVSAPCESAKGCDVLEGAAMGEERATDRAPAVISHLGDYFTEVTAEAVRTLGKPDRAVIDHLTDLQVRGARYGMLGAMHPETGKPLPSITQALEISKQLASSESDLTKLLRLNTQIGDSLLLLEGYQLGRPKGLVISYDDIDDLLDRRELGRTSYFQAAQVAEIIDREKALLWLKLSADFELWCQALRKVKAQFPWL